MMIESTIENYILSELLPGRKSQIDYNESLISSGVLDSLTLLQLIAFLEEKFGISVDDSEMNPNNFQTIKHMSMFIEGKLGEGRDDN